MCRQINRTYITSLYMKNIILSIVLGAALLGSAQACGCAAHRGHHHGHHAVMHAGKHHRHHHDRHTQRPGRASITGAGNHTAAPKAEVAPNAHKPQAPQAQAPRKHKLTFGPKNHRPFWGPNARRQHAAK